MKIVKNLKEKMKKAYTYMQRFNVFLNRHHTFKLLLTIIVRLIIHFIFF